MTANRLRSVLVKMFGWAVDNALLDNNPVLGTKKPTKESRGKTRTLNDAETRLLWSCVRSHHLIAGCRRRVSDHVVAWAKAG